MKVLYVLPHSFLPANKGNKHLTAGLLRFTSASVECDVAVLLDPDEPAARVTAEIRAEYPRIGEIHTFRRPRGLRLAAARARFFAKGYHPALGRYWCPELREWLLDRVARAEGYDLVHFDMVHVAPYLRYCGRTPSVLVASDAYSRSARSVRRHADRVLFAGHAALQEIVFRNYERRQYHRFDAVCLVSEVDLGYLQDVAPRANLRRIGIALPPGFHTRAPRSFASAGGRPVGVLCTGSLDHQVVAGGAVDFLTTSGPEIQKAHPGTPLVFLGQAAHPTLLREISRTASARYIDFVPEYRDFLEQDWVYVYPQRCGSGLQTKVQQAMALGLPVVGYAEAFGGLDVVDGEHCFIARSRGEFTRAVNALLRSSELRSRIGLAAANHVRERFSVQCVGERMLDVYREVTGGAVEAPSAGGGEGAAREVSVG